MIKKPGVLFVVLFVTTAVFAQIKVACVGNSITYGYGLSSPNTQSYPARLQGLLGTAQYTVQNDGVNATTLLKNGDNSYWKNGKLADVFSFQPKIVTIKLGTNDTKPQNWDKHYQEFKRDYLAMVDTFAAMASKPRIYAILPVPVFSNATAASWGIRDSAIKKEMPMIRQVASERGLTVIDCNTPLLNFPQYFSVDGVHPNAAGEDTLAHVIYRSIIATSVVPMQPAASRRNTGVLKSAYPVFNGCNMAALFAEIKPGHSYDLGIFTANGALVNQTSLDASSASRGSIKRLFAHTPAMRWVVLKTQPAKNVRNPPAKEE